MKRPDLLDNSLHAAGGFLLAVPLRASHPVALFVVFALFGLLREQAQRSELGWIGAFIEPDGDIRWHKVIEGCTWGLGAALCGALF